MWLKRYRAYTRIYYPGTSQTLLLLAILVSTSSALSALSALSRKIASSHSPYTVYIENSYGRCVNHSKYMKVEVEGPEIRSYVEKQEKQRNPRNPENPIKGANPYPQHACSRTP